VVKDTRDAHNYCLELHESDPVNTQICIPSKRDLKEYSSSKSRIKLTDGQLVEPNIANTLIVIEDAPWNISFIAVTLQTSHEEM
jgi:hypothetical protein